MALALVDHGPEDDDGLVTTEARDGGVVAVARAAAWPAHLYVASLTGEAAPALLAALVDRYGGALPERLTCVTSDRAVLRWVRSSPFAAGAVLAGRIGERVLFCDPVGVVDPETPGEVAVTMTAWTGLRAVGEVRHPTLADARRWFAELDPVSVIAAVRRLGLDPGIDPGVAGDAHELALRHGNAAVRQHAALQLTGFDPYVVVAPDLDRLLDRVRDPFGGDDAEAHAPPGSRAQTRRNVRYAVLWALACMTRRVVAPQPPEPVVAAVARLGQVLRSEVEQGVHDAALVAWAAAEWTDHPVGRFGVGVDAPVRLIDLLRYATVRAAGIGGRAPTDRFRWLAGAAAEVAAVGGPAVAGVVAAPAVGPVLDGAMPAWLMDVGGVIGSGMG